jgi:hypothetical protein
MSMPTVAVDAIRIEYPKRWFALGAAIDLVAMAAMIYLAYDSVEDFGRIMWSGCAVVICVPLLILFGTPLFTAHYIGEKGLRLRMGLLINTTVPYKHMKAVSDAQVSFGSIMIGIGVKHVSKGRTMFVTASFKDLISIRLDGPQQLGSPLRPLVENIVLTVKDKEGFVALIKDRAGLEA